MTGADPTPFDDIPEADLAAQWRAVDDSDDNGLDPTQLTTTQGWDANEADLIDQAISIALPDDERDIYRRSSMASRLPVERGPR